VAASPPQVHMDILTVQSEIRAWINYVSKSAIRNKIDSGKTLRSENYKSMVIVYRYGQRAD